VIQLLVTKFDKAIAKKRKKKQNVQGSTQVQAMSMQSQMRRTLVQKTRWAALATAPGRRQSQGSKGGMHEDMAIRIEQKNNSTCKCEFD
jgi:hypothetical protein